jgi:sec-independent protein translocase protein TatA
MAIGPWQIILIVLVVVLLFGAGRIAEIGKGLGEGIKNFKKGISGDDEGAGKLAEGKKKKKKKDKVPKQLAPKRAELDDEEEEEEDEEEAAARRRKGDS